MKHKCPKDFDFEDILEALEEDRKSGALRDGVTTSAIRYGIDPDNPERIVAVDAHGNHVPLPLANIQKPSPKKN